MISFIVIGRNEGEKLRLCFNSIYDTISFNSVQDFEILYIDSKSIDNSIQIAKEYEEISIYSITDTCNAAIARNIGGNEAKGDVLFFIDGDMEINKHFFSHVFSKNMECKYPLVTGQIIDVVEDYENTARVNDKLQYLTCGVFIIRKKLWKSVNGMRTKFLNGEDVDLGLRLIKKGFPLVCKPEIITKHFTVPYLHKSRIWKMMWNKSTFYSRCVLYRDLIWNKNMYSYMFHVDKTFILLVLSLVLVLIFPAKIFLFSSIYFIAILLRSFKQKKHMSVFEYAVFFTISDVLNLFYFFTFFPKMKNTEYIAVN